jgi:hypothetical protein
MKFSHYFQCKLLTQKKDGYTKIKDGHNRWMDGWMDEQMDMHTQPCIYFKHIIKERTKIDKNYDKSEHVRLCY